jgi:hypothetical protein
MPQTLTPDSQASKREFDSTDTAWTTREQIADVAARINGICAAFNYSSKTRSFLLLAIEASRKQDVVRVYDDQLAAMMYTASANPDPESSKRQLRRWRKAAAQDFDESGSPPLVSVKCGDQWERADGTTERVPTEYDCTNLWRLLLAMDSPRLTSDKPDTRAKHYQAAARSALRKLDWKPSRRGRRAEWRPTAAKQLEMDWTRLDNDVLRVLAKLPGGADERRARIFLHVDKVVSAYEKEEKRTPPRAKVESEPLPEGPPGQNVRPTDVEPIGLSEIDPDKMSATELLDEPDQTPGSSDASMLLTCLAESGCQQVGVTSLDTSGRMTGYQKTHPLRMANHIDSWLTSAENRKRSVIARPEPKNAWFQTDDITTTRAVELADVATFAIETSPNKAQVWFRLSESDRENHARIHARLIAGMSADPSASGAMRLAGSLNFKYQPPPRVKLLYANPDREVTETQLEAAGLLAPAAPQTERRTSSRRGAVSPVSLTGGAIPIGTRHDKLFRAACAIRGKGADYNTILDFVRESNQKLCLKSVSERDCERIARRVVDQYQPNGGPR